MEHLTAFLDQIAETMGYDRDSLSLQVEIQNGGPTVSPNNSGNGGANVVKAASLTGLEDRITPPSIWYDDLGSNHADYRIFRKIKRDTGPEIKKLIYAYQHHTMPGNCRICVNRWVRVLDSKKWPAELVRAGLIFRVSEASRADTSLMLITTGASFSGAEPMDDYEELFSGCGRSIHLIKVKDFLKKAA